MKRGLSQTISPKLWICLALLPVLPTVPAIAQGSATATNDNMHSVRLASLSSRGVAEVVQSAGATVTHQNLTKVSYGLNGEQLGWFRVDRDGGQEVTLIYSDDLIGTESLMLRWVQIDMEGRQIATFGEVSRLNLSSTVILRDEDRGTETHLDLASKTVRQNDRDVFQIIRAEAALLSDFSPVRIYRSDWMNGRSVFSQFANWPRDVVVGRDGQNLGFFRTHVDDSNNRRYWTKIDAQKKTVHTFEERHYDEWSIYLHDATRGVNLQIDLHTRKVYQSAPNSPRSELYDILSTYRRGGGEVTGSAAYAFR